MNNAKLQTYKNVTCVVPWKKPVVKKVPTEESDRPGTTPGPGQYNIEVAGRKPITSMFTSKVPRS